MDTNKEWLSRNQQEELRRVDVTFHVQYSSGDDGWKTEDLRLTEEEIAAKKEELDDLMKKPPEQGGILDWAMFGPK